MTERDTPQSTAPRPTFGERLGFYAYMLAVGGGMPDRGLFSTVIRRPELVREVTRPQSEASSEDDGTFRAA
jgi:hypothetical protein